MDERQEQNILSLCWHPVSVPRLRGMYMEKSGQGITHGDTVALIDRLHANGYIDRIEEPCPHGVWYYYVLTPAGRARLAEPAGGAS